MNNVNKAILSAVFALLLIGTVSASTLGTYVSEESKDIDDLEATFNLKVMNMGEETVSASIETTDIDDADLIYDEEIDIEPSIITSSPSDEQLDEDQEWYLLDGEYVQVQKVPINVVIDQERSQNNFEFTTSIEATENPNLNNEEEDDEVAPQQEIIQTRDYTMRLSTSADRSGTTQDTEDEDTDSETDDSEDSETSSGSLSPPSSNLLEDSSDDFDISISDEDGGSDDTQDETTLEEDEGIEDGEEDSTSTSQTDNQMITGEFTAAVSGNITTIMLLLTSVLSIGYLIRVV